MSSRAVASAEIEDFAYSFGEFVRGLVGEHFRTPVLRAYREDGADFIALDWSEPAGGIVLVTICVQTPLRLPERLECSMEICVTDTTDALQLVRVLLEAVQRQHGGALILREAEVTDE